LRSYKKDIFVTILGSLVGIVIILGLILKFLYDFSIKKEIDKARLLADTIISFRSYLSDVAPCVNVNDCKINPFACTPAYAVNQTAKILKDKNHLLIRQVSDRYRNIKDKPNWIEYYAIEYFKTNPKKEEFYQVHNPHKHQNGIFGQKHIFYARVLRIKKSCLRCHGDPKKDVPPKLYKLLVKDYGNKAFGYKIGDVRGIISIYIPFGDVNKMFFRISIIILISFLVIYILGTIIFKRVTDRIGEDLDKIINYLKTQIAKGRLVKLKDEMNYVETDILKREINNIVGKLKNNQKELFKKYYLNPITNLFNRSMFFHEMNKNKYPLVILNVDQFREINNYFGIKIADKLIVQISQRLKNLRKKYKFKIYHINVDEFILLFSKVSSKEELKGIVREIIKELEKTYNIDSNEISLKFRAGISFVRKDYLCAEMALEAAKDKNIDIEFCNNVQEYYKKYEEHLKWLTEIKKALEDDRIIPFYQPIVDNNKKIVKYEALVRLKDENGKIISPFFFLEVAKKTRYYLEITKIMLNKVIDTINTKKVAISINISLEDIESKEMRDYIFKKIEELTNKSLLTIEIVETEDIRNSEDVSLFLNEVKKLGVDIYIDDFGSGYANFDYLLKIQPNGIKIDGSLIKDILENENNQKIVKTIISFAKDVNIKTVAEFVENEEIFKYLINLGVDYFQGYYFSPPREDIVYEV